MPSKDEQSASEVERVFQQLVGEIVRGVYKPGSVLPFVRLLELLKVERSVLRPALERLAHNGLVELETGDAQVRVLDYREHAGLDMLPLIAEHLSGRAESAAFWSGLLEARASINVDVARLCAERANRAIRQQIVALSQQMRAASDDETLYELQLRFWRAVQQGSNNIVYRLAFNSMLQAVLAMGAQAHMIGVREVRRSDYYAEIAAAIAESDPERAERVTREVMQAGLHDFRRKVRALRTGAVKKE